MPEVVLQDYLEDINQLIEESRLGEAVRHCRAILEQYPRHIDTYRLLGKAYLEQGELQAASDVFHRVLSADPEDFIAHAGLAIVYKQQEQLKEAVWHMQRAFEMDPYNGAIREALKDLYSKRDGMAEGQLPLSRGALARLHVKGELYTQAIVELRELLAEDPARVDLQALLAEALWRDGQRVEAVEVCQQLLEALPFCIKANAILGEVWMVTERQDEAAEYVERVFDMTLPAHDVLEDDTPSGRLFLTEGAPQIPQQVLVEPLAGTEAGDMSGMEPGWALDFDVEGTELDDAEPEWLEALQSGEEQALPVEDVDREGEDVVAAESEWAEPGDSAREEPVADLTTSDQAEEWPEQLADAGSDEAEESSTRWLRDSLGEFQGLGEAEDDEADWATWLDHERESEEPEAVSQEQLFSEIEEEGMGATDELGKGQDEMPDEEMPRPQEEQPLETGSTESFDWLDELADAGEPAYSEQAFSEDALSEDAFAEDAFAEDAFAEDALAEDAVEPGGDALPDWLMEDAGVVDDLDDTSDTLDWLDTEADSELESVDDAVALPSEDLPDWLNEEDDLPEQMDEAGSDDDLSWLDDLAAGEGSAIEEPPTMSWPEDEADDDAQAQIEAADDVAMDDVPEDLDDAMAWLEQLAAQQGAPVEELPSLSAVSETPDEEVLDQMPADIGDAMDWLEELSEDDEVAEPAEAAAAMAPVDEPAGMEDEDELTWLEGLSGPVDAGDADFDVVEEPVTPVSAAAREELDEGDEGMDWLEGLGGPADFEESVTAAEVDDSEPADEPMTPVSAAELEELDDEDSEALDWLDELVADDVEQEPAAVASDELPQAEAAETDAPAFDMDAAEGTDEAPEDLDDALAWLEQLAARQGAPTDELPSLQSELPLVEEEIQEEAALFDEEPLSEEPLSEEPLSAEAASTTETGPEDDLDWLEGLEDEGELDDAWLNELTEMDEAEEQPQMAAGEEGEELPLTGEEVDDVPEDMDEAMAWLEQLAARQGAPVDELPSLDETAAPGEASASTTADADAMAELDDIPDDPEEALAWLEALAEGETSVDEEAEVVEEPSTPAVPHDVVAARAEAEAILMHDEMDAAAAPSEEEIFDDIPEDPDEAMAWLEQLAARQGAPLDELPSVSEAAEEVETPNWIAREAEAEARVEEAVEPAAPEGVEWAEPEAEDLDVPAPDVESETEADVVSSVAEAGEQPVVESETLMDELAAELEIDDDQLGDAMPDWLGLGDEDGGAEDTFDWDDVEGDVAGWLEAEEEATQYDMPIPDVTAEISELAASEPTVAAEADVEADQFEPVAEEAPPTEWQQPAVENERLASARQAVEMGDLDSAVATYGKLVESGEDLNLLISDLEGAVGTQGENARLRTVLGDAYMRNGQLQKALDAYRQALDSL